MGHVYLLESIMHKSCIERSSESYVNRGKVVVFNMFIQSNIIGEKLEFPSQRCTRLRLVHHIYQIFLPFQGSKDCDETCRL